MLNFTFNQNDDVAPIAAPQFVSRGIHITATISEPMGDGVIVAQGGSVVGFSLYVKDNHLCFATRRDRKATIIRDTENVPSGPVAITADMSLKGDMTLTVNGKSVATGSSPGAIAQQPGEGLQVGRDKGGAVGDYRSPFIYRGKIEKVSIELSKEEASGV